MLRLFDVTEDKRKSNVVFSKCIGFDLPQLLRIARGGGGGGGGGGEGDMLPGFRDRVLSAVW